MPLSSQIPLAYWGLTTPAWIVMWSVIAALTVVLCILLRVRWMKNRTWRMCVVLSLWMHLIIVIFSMTIRIVAGGPQAGNGDVMRVAVIDVSEPIAETKVSDSQKIEPLWEQLSAPALVPPTADLVEEVASQDHQPRPDTAAMKELIDEEFALEPFPATELEAPSLMPAPKSEKENKVEDEIIVDSDVLQRPEKDEELTTNQEQGVKESSEQSKDNKNPASTTTVKQSDTNAVPTDKAIPNLYADRFAEDLTDVASERGGSAETEAAVKAALAWLAKSQSKDGGWDASKFGAGVERKVLGHDRQGAGSNADTGVTGLAILAFLGAGHSHLHGDYRKEVANALEYLRQRQRADGSLFADAELYARMYCHSMATLAVCEAYAMTRDKRLDPMARAAVGYSLAMQHPTDGGWRYRRGDTGDTSQLGWQLMALKSAELAGIDVPDLTWARAERFLRRVRRGDHGGLAAYRPDGPPSRTMTAEAWFCHQLLQADRGGTFNSSAILEAIESLEHELPQPNNRNLYYWYYATLALRQNEYNFPEGSSSWESWNNALTTALIATQESDGSWDANTVWGGYGGKVYTTALSALCLEVYYRYNPSQSTGNLADREDWQSQQR